MKHKLIITVLVAFFALTVKAQQGGGQGMNAESMAQRESAWMKTELNLTADQVTKVDAINLKYAQEQTAAFQGGQSSDPSARQKLMADMNAKKRTELQAVLTADQLKKYDEYLANRTQQGGRGGFGGPPPGQ